MFVNFLVLVLVIFHANFGSFERVREDEASDVTHDFDSVHGQDFSLVVYIVFNDSLVEDFCANIQKNLCLLVVGELWSGLFCV